VLGPRGPGRLLCQDRVDGVREISVIPVGQRQALRGEVLAPVEDGIGEDASTFAIAGDLRAVVDDDAGVAFP